MLSDNIEYAFGTQAGRSAFMWSVRDEFEVEALGEEAKEPEWVKGGLFGWYGQHVSGPFIVGSFVSNSNICSCFVA
jgi:hypothetical protein